MNLGLIGISENYLRYKSIFWFYSKIVDSIVHENDNPLTIEKKIRKLLQEKPKWARR